MLQWIKHTINNLKRTATIGRLILLAVLFYFIISVSAPVTVQAQVVSQADVNSELMQGVQIIEEPLGLPATDIRLVIARIIRIALSFIGIIVLVLMMYAGFLWMTAGGNEDQIDKSKKILKNATIGLAIVLSAYAIVAFVMRMLGVDMSGIGGGRVAPPGVNNFAGSGALGRIVKDHYPQRNQSDVPRNTRIIITFFRPISLNNLVTDTNNDGVLGTCNPQVNNWQTDCDALNLNNDYINISRIIPSNEEGGQPTLQPISGAALLAMPSTPSPDQPIGIYTIVIRPYDVLGSDVENVSYQVQIGNNIKRDDPDLGNPGIFDGLSGSKFYQWYFTCGTELDLSPPYVVDVYPKADSIEYKNTVIQIGFNEAIDPIGVQGMFAENNDHYFLQNGFIYLKNNNSSMPVGVMNLVNNYRTLEFTPSVPCGRNACGGVVYCLPVCDRTGAGCNQDSYQMLLKAAITINNNSFESQPFTGVADVSGNALDGNRDLIVQTAPTIGQNFDIGKAPDNYWWSFTIKDEMDLIPPIISQVVPGPEAPFITAQGEWSMWFDKRMRIEPMYSISIEESPTPQERCNCYTRDESGKCVSLPNNQCVLDFIWHVPYVTFSDEIPKTKTNQNHGLFLDGLPQGYIPNISSLVEDVNFNCIFPGQGPKESDNYNISKASGFCDKNPENCCLVGGEQVLCCNGVPANNNAQTCINSLLTPIN